MPTPITSLPSAALTGKTILMRTDFNCPLSSNTITDPTRIDRTLPLSSNTITDPTRIDRTLPGITDLTNKGASIILLTHLGRPKSTPTPQFSLTPIAHYIEKILHHPLPLIPHPADLYRPKPGQIIMLENLRFWPGEQANDPAFAAQLATHADIYVNDAFSCAHRAHASTHALARLLPSYAGPLMSAELQALTKALDTPRHPLVAVVGGAKISTKLDILTTLITKTDHLILGGAMANTFLAAQGINMQKSLIEPDFLPTARAILKNAKAQNCQIHLPSDGLAASHLAPQTPHRTAACTALKPGEMLLDIGPASIENFTKIIDKSRTMLWNGPMGAFETPPFDRGTIALAHHTAAATDAARLTSIAGGGDTLAALNHAGITSQFSYVSLAGGAFLEWIEGKILPGLAILKEVC